MNRSSRALIAGLVFLAGLPAPAPAQQDSVDTLPEIVVTATRRPVAREAVAARVTVLDGEALRARGITLLADALREVPGVSVVQVGSLGGLTSVFLRGGESDYVQVLVDGVPLNQPGGAVDLADLTLDNVERVEIVRGPTSVLYGSDAVSGVIQVFTRRGNGPARLEAAARAGTYGTLDLDLGVHGAGAGIGYSLVASRLATGGLYDLNNDYQNGTVSGRLHATPDERTTVDLSLRYQDTEFHFPTDGAGNVVDANAFQLGTRTLLGLELGRRFAERVEGRLLLSSNAADGGLDDRPDHGGDTLGFFAARSQVDLRRQGADGRVLVGVLPGGELTVGAAVERQQERSLRQDFSEFGTFTGGTDTTVTRLNHAYYAQLHLRRGTLALNAGGRVDVNEEFGVFPTVRAGVAWRLPTGTRLYASTGTAFKEPTFFEHFGGSSTVGNPDLDPERSVSVEVGAEQHLVGGRVVVAVTAFVQRFRDLIDFTFTPANPGDPNYFNVAGASSDGLEFEATVRPVPPLTLQGHLALLRTEVTDSGFDGGAGSAFGAGQALLRRPGLAAHLEARYRPLERATVGAALRHVGRRDDLDFSAFPAERVTLAPYTLVDLSLDLTLLRPGRQALGLALTGRVENLFDADYRQVLGFRTRGRTVLVGGRVTTR